MHARNISVFGLAFTISVSGTIVRLDLVLLRFLMLLPRKSSRPRLERWIQDGVFQLQRRAYEARGNAVWVRLKKEVPITKESTKLADLEVESYPPVLDANADIHSGGDDGNESKVGDPTQTERVSEGHNVDVQMDMEGDGPRQGRASTESSAGSALHVCTGDER